MWMPHIDPKDFSVAVEVDGREAVILRIVPFRRRVIAVYVSRETCKQIGEQDYRTGGLWCLKRDPEPIEMPIADAVMDGQLGKIGRCILHL
jgi:hypothetical protein